MTEITDFSLTTLFRFIDRLEFKGNLFREHQYTRKVIFWFSTLMIFVWFLLGFDSGMGMIENAVKHLPSLLVGHLSFSGWQKAIYSVYGRTFHFSAFVIYGYLFCGLSLHLETLGVKRSRNLFYSLALTMLNIAIFELWWMGSFAYFHERRTVLEWLVNEFWFCWRYIVWIVLGLWVSLLLRINDDLRFEPNRKMLGVAAICLGLILFWYYYPFPFEQVYGGFFPQTHYFNLYVPNNPIHLVNIMVKTMFAFTQYYILRGSKNE